MRITAVVRLARAGVAVVLVVAGAVLAVGLGHDAVIRAEQGLSATAATATAVAGAAHAASGASTAPAPTTSASAPAPSTAPSGASAPRTATPSEATGASPAGLSAARLARLGAQVAAVATRYAAVAPHQDVVQFCLADVDTSRAHANLRATVRAQLPVADQGLTDAQLDQLLDAAARRVC